MPLEHSWANGAGLRCWWFLSSESDTSHSSSKHSYVHAHISHGKDRVSFYKYTNNKDLGGQIKRATHSCIPSIIDLVLTDADISICSQGWTYSRTPHLSVYHSLPPPCNYSAKIGPDLTIHRTMSRVQPATSAPGVNQVRRDLCQLDLVRCWQASSFRVCCLLVCHDGRECS